MVRGPACRLEDKSMPHLQIDVPGQYPVDVKRKLAQRIGNMYAEIMQTTPDLVDVTFRELGEGSVWRCGEGAPTPSAVLSFEIRRGRPPEQRARLGDALIDACVEALGLDPVRVSVEFTQHAGDEIYKKDYVDGVLRGGLGKDWSPEEATTPLMESLKSELRARK
jgi:phenylpyruvate tautomerase PptA (4-oxalocrotonate tautomerase family)